MLLEKVYERENSFALKLIDSNATQFTIEDRIDIGDGCEIIKLKAPYDSYYYKTETKKTQICLHFTVGVISGDIATLTKKDSHVSVPYVVDRQGRIYQLFDDKYWSYHLGASAIGGNGAMSKQSIGIEISNYGPLTLDNGMFKDIYKTVLTSDSDQVVHTSYRGYEYYEKMPDAQLKSVCRLLKYLVDKHGISNVFKDNMGSVFASSAEAKAFQGIFCHTDVRADKYDWPTEIANTISGSYNNMCTNFIEKSIEKTPENDPKNDLINDPKTEENEPVEQVQEVSETVVEEHKEEAPAQVAETSNEEHQSIFELIISLLLSLFKKS